MNSVQTAGNSNKITEEELSNIWTDKDHDKVKKLKRQNEAYLDVVRLISLKQSELEAKCL